MLTVQPVFEKPARQEGAALTADKIEAAEGLNFGRSCSG